MAFTNLALSTAQNIGSSTFNQAYGMAYTALYRKLIFDASAPLRFAYRSDEKYTWWRILTNSAFQTLTAQASDQLKRYAKELLKDKKRQEWLDKVEARRNKYNLLQQKGMEDYLSKQDKYGKMCTSKNPTNNTPYVVAYDMYKHRCCEALMLGIDLEGPIAIKQISTPNVTTAASSYNDTVTFNSDRLIWYDCTAIITFSSTRNVVLTQVTGRDYTRKELISNGDVEINVSGHILSPQAEVCPESEMKKFIEIMNHKGPVLVNNYLLDQYNIEYILIKNYSINPVEGTKNRLDYSFSAVGIQPNKEVEHGDVDTLNFIDHSMGEIAEEKDAEWVQYLKDRATELSGTAINYGAVTLNNFVRDL